MPHTLKEWLEHPPIPWVALPSWVVALAVGLLSASAPVRAQDTLVVRADQSPLWGSAELVEELRIGSLDSPPQEVFGRLADAAVGPHGEIVVADRQGPALRLFDPGGEYVRDLGHPGQGPGEFRQVAGVRFTTTGHIAIWDPGNQRISLFDTTGAVANTIRVNSALQGGQRPFEVDTAGNFYVRAIGSHDGPLITQFVWIKVGPEGDVLDSLPIPSANSVGRPLVAITPGGPRKPFTLETVAALSPHGYQVAGRTDQYAISRPLRDGRVLRIERATREVRVGADEGKQWQALLEFMESGSPSVGEAFRPIPSRKPIFRALWVDGSGRIWVSLYTDAVHVPMTPAERERRGGRPSLEWVEPPVWDVLDDKGRLLGTVFLPMNAILVAARDRRIWLIEHGAFGEDYLVRYRVEGHSR